MLVLVWRRELLRVRLVDLLDFLSMRSEMIEEKFKISRIEWDIWVLSILAYVVR